MANIWPTPTILHLVIAIWAASLNSIWAISFSQSVDVVWGGARAAILNNGSLLALSEDKISGSGVQSKDQYLFGKIDMQLKLVPGNSAGTVTAFYLFSSGSNWDEIDFEFLGNVSGQPYVVHTNIYTQGKGDREQQFYLGFDPTADFHNYTILWNPNMVAWYVDGKAIRVFPNMEVFGVPFPKKQPMRMAASIWNGEEWATRGGMVKTDWTKAPFTASFQNFNPVACTLKPGGGTTCDNANKILLPWYWRLYDLTTRGQLLSFQKNNMIYNYCSDTKRFSTGLPTECRLKILY